MKKWSIMCGNISWILWKERFSTRLNLFILPEYTNNDRHDEHVSFELHCSIKRRPFFSCHVYLREKFYLPKLVMTWIMNKRNNNVLIKRDFISIVWWWEIKKTGHGIELYRCSDGRNNKKEDTDRWMEWRKDRPQ
jgi:hypothetical protein